MSLLINDFKKGWQNKSRHESMHDDAVYVASDVDFSETCMIKARKSFTTGTEFPFYPHANYVAFNNMYKVYVEGVGKYLFYASNSTTGLLRYNSVTKTATAISSSLLSTTAISYATCRPALSSYTYVYITNGVTMLCDNGTTNKTWGIDPPEGSPSVTVDTTTGQLSAGDYSYVYTFYDNSTGSESDPSPACASITVEANDSVMVSNIETSSNARVTSRRLYRTISDGGTRYLVAIIPDNVVREYIDTIPDANLTQAVTTDQGAPPLGSVVAALGNVLFLTGNPNYPNRVYYSRADYPDNFPSTYYIEAGPGGVVVQNMLVLEGKMYFITKTGIVDLYGYEDQPETFGVLDTKASEGTYARWSPAVASGRIYYLTKTGVSAFDGVRSEKVSTAIERLFGDTPTELYPIVNKNTAATEAKGVGFNGKYYLKVPLLDYEGETYNRLLEYDPVEQQWRLIKTTTINGSSETLNVLYDIFADNDGGVLLGVLGSVASTSTYKQVFNLLATDTPYSGDVISPEVVTKSYDFTAHTESPVKAPEVAYGQKASKVDEIAWLKEFRIDGRGTWTFYFYVDGTLRHTETLTSMTKSSAYEWHDFPSKIKGRYVYVKATATSAGPTTHELREIEVR